MQIALFFLVVLALAKPMGSYMTLVFERRRTWFDSVAGPIERLLYRATGIKPDEEMRWPEYLVSMLIFSAVTLILTYVVERAQLHLPFNPQHLVGVEPGL